MAYVDPNTVHNPTTGQAIPASWGDIVRDDLEWLAGGMPHCSVSASTPQTVTTGSTGEVLTANTETSDIGGMHSGSSSQIVIPSGGGGLYVISAIVTFDTSATGFRQFAIDINGGTPITLQKLNACGTGSTVLSGSLSYNLSPADTVECRGIHTHGSDLGVTLTDLSVRWVAEA